MPVIRYEGWTGCDGQIGDKTTVVWRCSICGIESKSRYGMISTYVGGTNTCRTCTRFGPPRTTEKAKLEYPCILDVKSFDKRGGVHSGSVVVAECSVCGIAKETRFQHIVAVVKTGCLWRCKTCARTTQFDISLRFPKDLSKDVLECDLKTLGKSKQITAHTRVKVKCTVCGETRWTEIKYYESGTKKCHSCVSRERVRALARTFSNQSKLHKRIKALFDGHGINGFESEVIIGRYRVDEANFQQKAVLEVNGDYWHANPRFYGPDAPIKHLRQRVPASTIWEADRQREVELTSLGYSVYVIWERDFEADPDACIEKFKTWLMKGNK